MSRCRSRSRTSDRLDAIELVSHETDGAIAASPLTFQRNIERAPHSHERHVEWRQELDRGVETVRPKDHVLDDKVEPSRCEAADGSVPNLRQPATKLVAIRPARRIRRFVGEHLNEPSNPRNSQRGPSTRWRRRAMVVLPELDVPFGKMMRSAKALL
jgi:hypothetical protein